MEGDVQNPGGSRINNVARKEIDVLKKMMHGGGMTKYRRFWKKRKKLIKLYMKEKGTCRNFFLCGILDFERSLLLSQSGQCLEE